MAVTWSVDRQRLIVVVELEGSSTQEQLYDALGSMVAEKLMGFGKLLDASRADGWVSGDEIQPVATTTVLYSRMKLGPVGPLAIVVTDERQEARAREYMALTNDSARKVGLFFSRAEAEEWLVRQPRWADEPLSP